MRLILIMLAALLMASGIAHADERWLGGDPVTISSGELKVSRDSGVVGIIVMADPGTDPDPPPAGYIGIFWKSGKFYMIDSSSNISEIGGAGDVSGGGTGTSPYLAYWVDSETIGVTALYDLAGTIFHKAIPSGAMFPFALRVGYSDDVGVRFTIASSGDLYWNDGTGTGFGDVKLSRSAANVLELNSGDSFLFEGGTADPSSPTEGQVFYRTDTNELKVYDGSSWAVLNGGGSSFVGIDLTGDVGSPQTLEDEDTLSVLGGDGTESTVSATDTITVSVDSTVARGAGTKITDTTVGGPPSGSTAKTAVFSWTMSAGDWEDTSQCHLSLFMRGTAFTGTPTLTLTVEDGTNTIATHVFSSLASGSHAYHLDLLSTCRTTGASGTIETTSEVTGLNASGAAVVNWSASNSDPIDTTGSKTYTVYLQWSAANSFNSMTVTSAGVTRHD